ncbi:MAG: hypothetical protein EOM52_06560 [Clostridia bacterium]|nr:hypothetical protein [Clostridia bacterium]
MKKHLSVLFLAVRGTLPPVLAALILMALLETGAFWLVLRGGVLMPLVEVWTKSRIPFIAAASLIAVCLLHLRVGTEAAQGYTLRRLRVKERAVTLWWWVAALVNLTVLWAAQLGMALLLSHWYAAATDPAFVNPQTVLMGFYQVDFLHGLFPLGEIPLWVRNGFFLATLGLCVARAPWQLRTGRKPVAMFAVLAITVVMFPSSMGQTMPITVLCLILFFILLYALYQLLGPGEEETA